MVIILKCQDDGCKMTLGCIDMFRWGGNPHFCSLCPDKGLCPKLRRIEAYPVNRAYKCPTHKVGK